MMTNNNKNIKIIISGGGTGGHIYPAVSIANTLKQRNPDTEILFVGAKGRMEMEKVPAAGYEIIGLPVVGLQRRFTLKNLLVPFKLFKSLNCAKKIIKDFAPDIVVGVGGYASAPTLRAAAKLGIATLIQEQNSYAGLTNKLLAKRAKKICVAYNGMENFFESEKIILTGNPVRQDLFNVKKLDDEAYEFFNLDKSKKTLLIVGGSLGARTLNNVILKEIRRINNNNIQLIWQTGKNYFTQAQHEIAYSALTNTRVFDFIYRMDLAFAAADIIVSRAGAGTISELCIVAKPCILVPSPNVTEDHQTKNAMALANENAAVKINDEDAPNDLIDTVLQLFGDEKRMSELGENISKLALPDAADNIVDEILKLIEK
ncbi:MAG: undecaprenyldiphospho-muramoylpentapeptide beta-N-acetylglucosaminyltransferase [Prevotellaceae bacterium]|jgi:UDP-N-acetylglucosamine--N-acetylmuramyl-(pentapeptide) pyrophosphoryl-undecaprenol N-acetylglucosamine transferase|nr:undecaprenyldiphospho-muramoylpentapeptide beta-N-acetylglucosaminyltransferase [Prevotellaceae bacterium]